MQDHVLVVMSNPVAGREKEYNDWYSNQHLADVLKVPGFKAARRYTLVGDDVASAKWKYLAIYEFSTDNLAETLAAMLARAGTPDMVLSEAMDLSDYAMSSWAALAPKLHAE